LIRREHPDLVKRLRVQAAIAREERARADALFLSIGQGVIATDEESKIIRINQVALDMLGFQKKELIGTWFPKTIIALHEDNTLIDPVDRPIARVFIKGEAISEHMYYKRKDGLRIPVAVNVSPVLLRGKPIGAIEIFRDTTIEMESDRMKTDFISVASHQLRTPLAAINTYSHMLSAGYVGELNDDQNSFMKIILSAVVRMNELISTLLNITRIEAGSITVEAVPTEVRTIAEELLVEFKPQADAKNIELSLQCKKKIPVILCDSLLVKEIYSNLLSNAIKYTPEGGSVHVELTLRGSDVIFCATDTGYGIPVSAQPLIFTKFFRADNILKTEASGTGLGLYLIKVLAENLNGEVWFKSKEDKGSSFYFALPLKDSPTKTGTFRIQD
jgi:PAS domain S-box-containing protein